MVFPTASEPPPMLVSFCPFSLPVLTCTQAVPLMSLLVYTVHSSFDGAGPFDSKLFISPPSQAFFLLLAVAEG